MKKILLIAVLTLIPSFVNAGSPSDNTYIAADCSASQSGVLASYCNGTTYCSTSSATSLPHYENNSQYKDFVYCTAKTLTLDGDTSTVVLCFKDQYQCLGVRACDSDYHGLKPEFSENTNAILGWGGISNPNTGHYMTTNIENIAQFKCCYQTSGYKETSFPSDCSSSANKVAWFQPNSCTASGASTTSSTGQYLTCKTGYYTGAASGKYTFPASTRPCSVISSIGCTACPSASDIFSDQAKTTPVTGTTNGYGAVKVTSCYIPQTSVGYYDTTGKFKVPSNCSYKN